MKGLYILEGTVPIEEPRLLVWATWFDTTDRRVARTELSPTVCVSTIFLGLDHGWGCGDPLLFETMVFWPESDHNNEMERYTTWAQAEQGHEAMVAQVRAWLEES